MKVRLHNRDIEDMVIENSYPQQFYSTHNQGITERVFDASLLGGKGFYREIFMENIHVGYGDLKMFRDTQICFRSDWETIELHFALGGDTNAEDFESGQSFQFGYNQHNIIYACGFHGSSKFPQNEHVKIFEVNMSPDFFKKLLPKENQQFLQFLKSVERKKTKTLSPHNFIVTPQMHLAIREILTCNRQGGFKKLFIEAKVIELLLLQLEQMADHNCNTFCSLKKSDVEKIYAIKEYILEHLDSSCKLIELAQIFHTNECTLKKGFKEVFGTTVFNFWSAAKMNQAKRMLLEEDLTISQVSDRIGYKNPQHFSTAFKKRFGFSPSSLKM